jgi:invasion protein IalB
MMKAIGLPLSAAFLVAMTAPAIAQAPAAQAPAAQEKQPNDPNEVVCEKQESTGSRIASRRVCMTRAQWAERKLQDRQELERVQIQRGAKGE